MTSATLATIGAAMVVSAVALPAAVAGQDPAPAQDPAPPQAAPLPPLTWEDVAVGALSTYPPLLIAELERAVAEGRLREARGAFDLDLFAKVGGTVDGYYEYTETQAGLEQFTGLWGSTVYGGYRLTTGETLPDYYRNRTFDDGELAFGLRIPLLKGGPIDPVRAGVEVAELELQAVTPAVARQRLDLTRGAYVAYHEWVAAGRKLDLARELLELAEDRTTALEAQVESGLRADIDLVDNQRLVVSREIAVVEAQRALREASVVLSLFLFRDDPELGPLIPGEDRLPAELAVPDIAAPDLDAGLDRALVHRPELAVLALDVAKEDVARRLASGAALPTLDARVEATRDFGARLYGDLARDELTAAVEFKLPIQRRAETGKQLQAETKLAAARTRLRFGRERVAADVRTAAADLEAALQQVERAELAGELAEALRAAEAERFAAGASDLLALQLREQAAFDAQEKVVDTRLKLHAALADWRAAIADGVDLAPGG
ncbi:MAG TPA: TolC family protein [Longimicrobiales bacterium]|nr:TolC family protein [Longimicrobiales bacterium]